MSSTKQDAIIDVWPECMINCEDVNAECGQLGIQEHRMYLFFETSKVSSNCDPEWEEGTFKTVIKRPRVSSTLTVWLCC